ncbi:hypothetical protein D3C73_1574820 [compost metagenome]
MLLGTRYAKESWLTTGTDDQVIVLVSVFLGTELFGSKIDMIDGVQYNVYLLTRENLLQLDLD